MSVYLQNNISTVKNKNITIDNIPIKKNLKTYNNSSGYFELHTEITELPKDVQYCEEYNIMIYLYEDKIRFYWLNTQEEKIITSSDIMSLYTEEDFKDLSYLPGSGLWSLNNSIFKIIGVNLDKNILYVSIGFGYSFFHGNASSAGGVASIILPIYLYTNSYNLNKDDKKYDYYAEDDDPSPNLDLTNKPLLYKNNDDICIIYMALVSNDINSNYNKQILVKHNFTKDLIETIVLDKVEYFNLHTYFYEDGTFMSINNDILYINKFVGNNKARSLTKILLNNTLNSQNVIKYFYNNDTIEYYKNAMLHNDGCVYSYKYNQDTQELETYIFNEEMQTWYSQDILSNCVGILHCKNQENNAYFLTNINNNNYDIHDISLSLYVENLNIPIQNIIQYCNIYLIKDLLLYYDDKYKGIIINSKNILLNYSQNLTVPNMQILLNNLPIKQDLKVKSSPIELSYKVDDELEQPFYIEPYGNNHFIMVYEDKVRLVNNNGTYSEIVTENTYSYKEINKSVVVQNNCINIFSYLYTYNITGQAGSNWYEHKYKCRWKKIYINNNQLDSEEVITLNSSKFLEASGDSDIYFNASDTEGFIKAKTFFLDNNSVVLFVGYQVKYSAGHMIDFPYKYREAILVLNLDNDFDENMIESRTITIQNSFSSVSYFNNFDQNKDLMVKINSGNLFIYFDTNDQYCVIPLENGKANIEALEWYDMFNSSEYEELFNQYNTKKQLIFQDRSKKNLLRFGISTNNLLIVNKYNEDYDEWENYFTYDNVLYIESNEKGTIKYIYTQETNSTLIKVYNSIENLQTNKGYFTFNFPINEQIICINSIIQQSYSNTNNIELIQITTNTNKIYYVISSGNIKQFNTLRGE